MDMEGGEEEAMEGIAILDKDEVLGFNAEDTAGILEGKAKLLESVSGCGKDFLGDPREVFLGVIGHDVCAEVVEGLFGEGKAEGCDGDGVFGEVVAHTKAAIEKAGVALGLALEDKKGIFAVVAVKERGSEGGGHVEGKQGMRGFLKGESMTLELKERRFCPERCEEEEGEGGKKGRKGAECERPEQEGGRGFPEDAESGEEEPKQGKGNKGKAKSATPRYLGFKGDSFAKVTGDILGEGWGVFFGGFVGAGDGGWHGGPRLVGDQGWLVIRDGWMGRSLGR